LWAMYGLGLLDGAAKGASATQEPRGNADADARKIIRYLKDDLGLDDDVDLKSEALRLSGVLPIRAELSKLPMEVLTQFAQDPHSEVDLVVEIFARQLKAYMEQYR